MLTRRNICGTVLAALLAGCELRGFDPADKRVVQTPADDAAARSVISADGVDGRFIGAVGVSGGTSAEDAVVAAAIASPQ